MKKFYWSVILICSLFAPENVYGQNHESGGNAEQGTLISNTIIISQGDSMKVEFENSENPLGGAKLVTDIADSTRSVFIKFTYVQYNGKKVSQLKVTNYFNKVFIYRAKVRPAGSKIYSETSIMPILPHIYGLELWQYNIESIMLYDFKVKKIGSDL